jgi:hypothetical protein
LARLLIVCATTGLVAACASAPTLKPSAQAPRPDAAAACLHSLDQRHILYERVQDWSTPEGCGVTNAVRIKQSAIPWNRPSIVTCSMENSIWDYETQIVQPAAQRHFGRKVRKLWHAGTYNCRGERGGRPERLSQHSFGKAIDITGFELDDGTVVSVAHDWRDKGEKSEFLHEVAKGACSLFSVVMTPNRNAEHHDHLHLDIGPHKLCGY